MIEYNLPEWALLDAHSHLGNPLGSRTVINHIRSASIIEIIDRDKGNFIAVEGVLQFKFKYTKQIEDQMIEQKLSAILHYCATLDKDADRELIREKVLIPCAKWYCDYCAWEDNNILNDIFNGE